MIKEHRSRINRKPKVPLLEFESKTSTVPLWGLILSRLKTESFDIKSAFQTPKFLWIYQRNLPIGRRKNSSPWDTETQDHRAPMISDKGAHLLVDRRLPGLDLARQGPRQEVGLRPLDVRWPDLRRLVAEEQVPIVLVDRPHERSLAEPPPLEPVLRVLPRGGLRGRDGPGNGFVRSRASPFAAGEGDRGGGGGWSHGSGWAKMVRRSANPTTARWRAAAAAERWAWNEVSYHRGRGIGNGEREALMLMWAPFHATAEARHRPFHARFPHRRRTVDMDNSD